MICWKCLRKMDPWLDERNRQTERCRCGNKPGPGNDQTRADRFMALVGQSIGPNSAGPHGEAVGAPMTACWAIDQAAEVMANIERRVESGTLFGEEKP